MSMMGRFVQVSPDRLKKLQDDPSGIEELFGGEQVTQGVPNMMERLSGVMASRAPKVLAASMGAMDPAMRDRFAKTLKDAGVDVDAIARGEGVDALAKLMSDRARALLAAAGQPSTPSASGGGTPASGKGASISIDKAWHGVHYLLCGKVEPGTDVASRAVMGGTEIGEDLGYGPARYFDVDEVAEIARELTRPNLEAEMTARFDPAQMANLSIYPGQFDAGGDRQWLMDAFQKLRQFYVDASAANLAVVTCLE